MVELDTPDAVRSFLEKNPVAVIFKAGSCRQTDEALRRLSQFFAKFAHIPTGRIDVVRHRTASDTVTSISGKKHESPQILLFRYGECVYSANHWRIDALPLIEKVSAILR